MPEVSKGVVTFGVGASMPPPPELPDVFARPRCDTVTVAPGVPAVRLGRTFRDELVRPPDALPRGLSLAEALAPGLVDALVFDDTGEVLEGLTFTPIPCFPPDALAFECDTDAFELDRPVWPCGCRAAPAAAGIARATARPITTIAFLISIHFPCHADPMVSCDLRRPHHAIGAADR
jgi:hypothetical protein